MKIMFNLVNKYIISSEPSSRRPRWLPLNLRHDTQVSKPQVHTSREEKEKTHKTRINPPQIRNPRIPRINSNLPLQKLNSTRHPLPSIHISVHEGAAQPDGFDAQRQQLDDIGAVPNAAIGEDFDLGEELGRLLVDLERDLEARGGPIDLPSPVVRQVDPVCALADCFLRVFDRLDPFYDYREGR